MMDMEIDKEVKMINKIIFNLQLPNQFPEHYREAIKKSVGLCAVKKTIQDPPDFETILINQPD